MSIYRGAGGSGDAINDSSSEATLVAQLVTQAQASEANASTSATAAAGSASNAANSANSASTSASNAATSATNAANSASTASTQASNAATSATAAQTAKTAAELAETNAETAQAAAASSASAASTSASNAATSATNASNSATAAATSATNASNSATAASTSATNSANSATAAAGSATTATTQATNASNSATAAASSATAAAGSATSASGSATTATTQAGIATTQATNAASSASAAATSATNASNSASTATTQATNASNSASAAATSASNAAASFDSFDDRYLGAKSVAPTLDNDGNTLLVGALYFNTVSNFMKVWDGSSWLDAYASLSGALLAANNLSDLTNTTTARSNLGVAIGTNVQAWDADLDTWATKTAPTGTVVGTSDTQTLTNKTLTSPVVTGGSIDNTPIGATTPSTGSFTSLTDSGNLTFTSTGNRIRGDFSNGTIANRVLAQSSTTNGNTNFGLIPNGTSSISAFRAYNNSDPTNASEANLSVVTTTDVRLQSTITGTGTYLPLTMFTGGSERLRIDTSGNVGIGTTSPAQRFVVSNAGAEGMEIIPAVNAGESRIQSYNRSGAAWNKFSINSGTFELFTNGGTSALFANTSGNVGIGTSSPSARLDVRTAAGTAAQLNLYTGNNTAASTLQFAQVGAIAWDVGITATNAHFQIGVNGGGLGYNINRNGAAIDYHSWLTAGSERMRIDSAGNVGIGVTDPVLLGSTYRNLYVAGGLGGVLVLGDTSKTFQSVVLGDFNNGRMAVGTITNHPVIISTNNTERMRIDSSGNVCVGVTAASYSLANRGNITIGGSNSGILGFRVNGANSGYIYHSSVDLEVWNQANGAAIFGTNNTERMRITSTGQLRTTVTGTTMMDDYGCRAWVNFNGTGTVAIRASGNVSSITDNGTGDYTVNFTTAMPDANYANVFGSNTDNTNGSYVSNMGVVSANGAVVTKTSSALRLWVKNQSWITTDGTELNVAVFR